MSRVIDKLTKRKLYAESMGKCMNPNCQNDLFNNNGDIIERAHIRPYCDNADNSFENLIILCPNCHTNFDKNFAFKPDEVKQWKRLRAEEVEKFFSKKCASFDELRNEVSPLLIENKTIYDNYYLTGNRELWDKFEPKILVNNSKLKKLLLNNLELIQHSKKHGSNLPLVREFLTHIDEFEESRLDEEKNRQILFPKEVNSLFGISPIKSSEPFLSVEPLEILISKLQDEGNTIKVILDTTDPYIEIRHSSKITKLYLTDILCLRQFYYNYNCFRTGIIRLKYLNFALKYINSRKVKFKFFDYTNLREIEVNNIKMIFIYEYCLSKASLAQLCPEANSVIVNLHNWNGESCISSEAHSFASTINVTLLDMDKFYEYIKNIQC